MGLRRPKFDYPVVGLKKEAGLHSHSWGSKVLAGGVLAVGGNCGWCCEPSATPLLSQSSPPLFCPQCHSTWQQLELCIVDPLADYLTTLLISTPSPKLRGADQTREPDSLPRTITLSSLSSPSHRIARCSRPYPRWHPAGSTSSLPASPAQASLPPFPSHFRHPQPYQNCAPSSPAASLKTTLPGSFSPRSPAGISHHSQNSSPHRYHLFCLV